MIDLLDQLTCPQDVFGYYQVGNFKTYSKLEAIEEETRTGHAVKWNFNDEVFSSYDWTVEPSESLNELYRQRAQQLREHYDYIVLNYSSGSDSDNILTAFIDNNIKLDEIYSIVNYDGAKTTHNTVNQEIYHCSIDRVKQAQALQPGIKHRVIDVTQPTIDYFANSTIGLDYGYVSNGYLGPHQVAKIHIRNTVPEWAKIKDAGKRVAFVWGSEKPFVRGINGKYYFTFRDMLGNTVTADQQINYTPGFFDELFYWNPNSAKILIKQGHVVKNYLKSATITTPFMEELQPEEVAKNAGNSAITFINKKIYRISFDGIRSIIYPKWRDNIYTYKHLPTFISPRDSWILDMHEDFVLKQLVKTTFNGVWNNLPDQWKNDTTKPLAGIRHCISKPYYLGE